MSRRVEAAGGVVLRTGAAGEAEVVVVHRPRYDDWSLPKGKLHAGERPRLGALREVEEETGLRCEAVRRLPDVEYSLPDGRSKRVRWWSMVVMSDLGHTPDDEVDGVRWVPVDTAVLLLTHGDDVATLTAALR